MAKSDEMWPKDFLDKLPTLPDAVLREQAKGLRDLTKGKLSLGVEKIFGDQGSFGITDHDAVVLFVYLSPQLVDYRYRLMKLKYKSTSPFPVTVMEVHSANVNKKLNDAKGLREFLREVFTSDETRQALSALYAQAISRAQG